MMNVYTIADNISAPKKGKKKLTPEQIAKRKERRKKAFFIFKKIALSMGRGAFLTLVVLNLGGLATKMKKLMDVKKFDPILKKWRQFGGSQTKLTKVVIKGAKKKPFFITKAQREKFNKKLATINGVPVVVAAITAAAPVLASVLGLIQKAFKQGAGSKTEIQEVQNLTQTAEKDMRNMVAVDQAETEKEPSKEEQEEALEQYICESLDVESINALDAESTGKLIQSGSQLVGAAFKALGNAFRRKKKNKAAGTFDKLGKQTPEQIENYFTGAYLRKAGAIDAAKNYQKEFGSSGGKLLPIAIGAAILGGIFIFAKNK